MDRVFLPGFGGVVHFPARCREDVLVPATQIIAYTGMTFLLFQRHADSHRTPDERKLDIITQACSRELSPRVPMPLNHFPSVGVISLHSGIVLYPHVIMHIKREQGPRLAACLHQLQALNIHLPYERSRILECLAVKEEGRNVVKSCQSQQAHSRAFWKMPTCDAKQERTVLPANQ